MGWSVDLGVQAAANVPFSFQFEGRLQPALEVAGMGSSQKIAALRNHRAWSQVVLVLVLVLAGVACKGRDDTRVTSYLRDGRVDEKAIVADVERPLSALAQGIAENDAELIFSIYSHTKPTTYVRDGKVADSVESAQESYEKALAKLKGKRTFAFQRKEFDVINEQTVLFTGVGVVSGASMKQPWTIAYTILFSLEAAGWKAINMHISWEETKP